MPCCWLWPRSSSIDGLRESDGIRKSKRRRRRRRSGEAEGDAHALMARNSSRARVKLWDAEGGGDSVVLVEPGMALVAVVAP